MTPDLSVIICAYEQADTLPFVLQAYLSQEVDASYELIVVDDGSSASTFASIRDLAQSAKRRVRWVWQQDHGFQIASSTNNGLRLATGRYVVLTDGDMVPPQNFLQQHLDAHREPGKLIAGNRRWRLLSALQSSGASTQEEIWHWLANDAAGQLGGRTNEFLEASGKKEVLKLGRPWLACWSCNLSVERSDAVYLDDAFHGWGCEDTELAYRLTRETGVEIEYRPEIFGYHLADGLHLPSLTRRHDDIVAYLRNLCYLLDKWPECFDGNEGISVPYALDADGETWHVTGIFEKHDVEATLQVARAWLAERGLYRVVQA